MPKGFSHLLQPRAWTDFFIWVPSNTFGVFIAVIYTLPPRALIIALHNKWDLHPSVFVTIAGWIMVIKSTIYAAYPSAFCRTAEKRFFVRSSRIAGAALILLTVILPGTIYVL